MCASVCVWVCETSLSDIKASFKCFTVNECGIDAWIQIQTIKLSRSYRNGSSV